MSYATKSWSKDGGGQYPNTNPTSRRAWLNDLSALVDTVDPTSHQITSTLSLLSASVKQGSALPPYIQRKYPSAPLIFSLNRSEKSLISSLLVPQPYNLSSRLEALDKGILDARHVEEPGYSAYGRSFLIA
jgi:hypothetical protein